MKVRELIAALQDQDPVADVVLSDPAGNFFNNADPNLAPGFLDARSVEFYDADGNETPPSNARAVVVIHSSY